MVLNAFKSRISTLQSTEGTCNPRMMSARIANVPDCSNLKILTPKQLLRRFSIVLAQVKAGNTSDNSQYEIQQIIYSLYRAKEVNKKVYDNIVNLVKVQYKMDGIFISSENNKTSNPNRLLFNLSDKIDLKRSNKNLALSNLNIYYTWKNIIHHTKTRSLKLQRGIINLIYLMDHVLRHIEYIIKKHKALTNTLQ